MGNPIDLMILKQSVIAMGTIPEISSNTMYNEIVFTISGALMTFINLEKTRKENNAPVAQTIKSLTDYVFECKGRDFNKTKIKKEFKAIYEALNSDSGFTKIIKPEVNFKLKSFQMVDQFRHFLLEFLSKNITTIEKKKEKTVEDSIMFEAMKIVAKNEEKNQDEAHLEFVKEKLIPDLRENTDWIRSKHQEMINILSATTTKLEPSHKDEDFIFYYVGLNHMLREVEIDIIEMMDKNDLDPEKIITKIHQIELINNAHLFDEKYKLFETFGKDNENEIL